MTQEVESGRRMVRGGWSAPCGQEVEKAEDIAGVSGMLDGGLWGGKTIVGYGDGTSRKADEGTSEAGMLGLFLAAGATDENRRRMRRWGY